MSKNIKLNNTNYNGVSTVQLPTSSGGTATFKDTDEITTPSGSKTITTNGTHDVTNFASAVVNVPTSGGSSSDLSIEEKMLCTVSAEDKISNILNANKFKLKYKKEILIINVYGSNAPTQGSHTLKKIILFIDNTEINGFEGKKLNGLISPDSIGSITSVNSDFNMAMMNSAYMPIQTDGTISWSENYGATRYVASGNTISYHEIPVDINTPAIDTTLRV